MKYAIALIMLLLTFTCSAENVNNEMIKIVTSRYHQSLAKLGKQAETCTTLRNTNKLPIEKIKQLNIPKDELSKGLAYYYIKSATNCEFLATTEYLLNADLLQIIDSSSKPMINASHELILSSFKLKLISEIEFNKLPTEIKEKLSTIKELEQPFNPIVAGEQLGLG